jgi:hypothetical protein
MIAIKLSLAFTSLKRNYNNAETTVSVSRLAASHVTSIASALEIILSVTSEKPGLVYIIN